MRNLHLGSTLLSRGAATLSFLSTRDLSRRLWGTLERVANTSHSARYSGYVTRSRLSGLAVYLSRNESQNTSVLSSSRRLICAMGLSTLFSWPGRLVSKKDHLSHTTRYLKGEQSGSHLGSTYKSRSEIFLNLTHALLHSGRKGGLHF